MQDNLPGALCVVRVKSHPAHEWPKDLIFTFSYRHLANFSSFLSRLSYEALDQRMNLPWIIGYLSTGLLMACDIVLQLPIHLQVICYTVNLWRTIADSEPSSVAVMLTLNLSLWSEWLAFT